MKGIDTLEAFHARLQTCEFWGDTWAISTLEVALNIKLVLFLKKRMNRETAIMSCSVGR